MTTTEVRRAARHAAPAQAARPSVTRAPLVLAAVVLLLWGVWLLVPHGTRLDLLGGSPGTADATAAGAAGAAADAARPAVPGPVGPVGEGGATDPTDLAAGAAPADPAAAGAAPADPAPADPAAAGAGPAEAGPPDPVPGAGGAGAAAPPAPADAGAAASAAGPVAVPQSGDGSFAVAPGTGVQVGDGRLVRYTVEVEGGVPLDPAEVAAAVEGVLADPRSWTGEGAWAFQRVDGDPDARIVVASPDTTDRMCAPLRTRGQVSCRNGDDVVLNALRWTQGARTWGEDVDGYRQYLVNHELGHYLGKSHVRCPGEGRPAPVMLQQTLGLQGCSANAWPYP